MLSCGRLTVVVYVFWCLGDGRFVSASLQIVDGNMVIKMAVKDTPAIIGNKLKQYYYKV